MDAGEFAMNENVMVDVADCITSQLPIAGQDDFGAGQAFQYCFASVGKRFKKWNVSSGIDSAKFWTDFELVFFSSTRLCESSASNGE